MIDEAKARGLQSMYRAGAGGALQPLYEECSSIAYAIALKKARASRSNGFNHSRLVEISHAAAVKLIERYVDNPAFHVRHFAYYIGKEVTHAMFTPARYSQQRFEESVTMVREIEFWETVDKLAPKGTDDAAVAIATSHKWGKKAIADLCRSRSYRLAIRRIAVYAERKWIYDHAEDLHAVYRTLHRKTPGSRIRGSGLGEVRHRLLQEQQRHHELADQRVDPNAEGRSVNG